MRQFLASINVVFFSRRLVQLSTESRVDIGFNPLKLFSDASINSSLVESSTASASTHNTNQVSLKWNVIFLTLTKLNKFRVQILGPFSQEFYKKKLSKSDFTHFFACLTFCRKMHLLLFHCTTCKLDLQSLLCNCLFHLKKDILKRHFSTL